MLTEADYQRAQREPEYRQEFLDELDLGEYAPFVGEVIQMPKNDGRALMATHCNGRITRIIVYPRAYSMECLGDFFGVLKFHEGRHAEQSYRLTDGVNGSGFTQMTRDLFQAEIDATHNELVNMHRLPHSHGYADSVARDFRAYCAYLETLERKGVLWLMALGLKEFVIKRFQGGCFGQ